MQWARLEQKWSESPIAWRLNGAIVVVAVLIILAIRIGVEPATVGDGEGCAITNDMERGEVEEPVALIPRPRSNLGFRWTFDADDTVKRLTTTFDWQNPARRPDSVDRNDLLEVSIEGELQNDERDESIPREQVRATAIVTNDGVVLNLCVDISGASPDRYSSAVSFADTNITAAPVQIDMTVRHRAEWIPLSAMVVGFALALVVLVLSVSDDETVKPSRIIALAIGALFVAIATTRPWQAWQDDPTWGKDRSDPWTLIAATALAFTGAMVASTTVPDLRRAARNTNGPQPATKDPTTNDPAATRVEVDEREDERTDSGSRTDVAMDEDRHGEAER